MAKKIEVQEWGKGLGLEKKTRIKYYNRESRYRLLQKKEVASWIESAIEYEGFGLGEVSFIFCGSEQQRELNREYLGHDYDTDVITFDYCDDGDGSAKSLSADIFIDPQTVRANARAYDQTARGEMLRVMIHGVLHLCGYGDATKSEQAKMRKREDLHLARWRGDNGRR